MARRERADFEISVTVLKWWPFWNVELCHKRASFAFHHEILVLGDNIQLQTPPNMYPKPPNQLSNLTLTSFFKVIWPVKTAKHAIFKKSENYVNFNQTVWLFFHRHSVPYRWHTWKHFFNKSNFWFLKKYLLFLRKTKSNLLKKSIFDREKLVREVYAVWATLYNSHMGFQKM